MWNAEFKNDHRRRMTLFARRVRFFAVLLACSWPIAARAEVMDKEPSLVQIWMLAVLSAIVIYLCLRFFRWWIVVPVIVLAHLANGAIFFEIHDPHVGPAIVAEAGVSYVVQAYLAYALVVVATIAGAVQYRRTSPRD